MVGRTTVCLAEGLVYAIPNTQRIGTPDRDWETFPIHRNPSKTPRGLEERDLLLFEWTAYCDAANLG